MHIVLNEAPLLKVVQEERTYMIYTIMHETNMSEFNWRKVYTSILLLAASEDKAILSTMSILTSLPAKGEDFSAIQLFFNSL